MFNSDKGYSLSDIAAATGNRNNGSGFGNGDGAWWIIILFLFIFCGWGENGRGGLFGGNGSTRSGITDGYILTSDFANIERKIDGVNNGIKNQNKQSSVFRAIADFGKGLLARLKASLQEKSPSKATEKMGQFLLDGLGIGIKDKENTVLKQVSNLGDSIISKLQDQLSNNVELNGLPVIKINMNLFQKNLSNLQKDTDFISKNKDYYSSRMFKNGDDSSTHEQYIDNELNRFAK